MRDKDNPASSVPVFPDQVQESLEWFCATLGNSDVAVFYQDMDLRYRWIHSHDPDFDSESVIGKHDVDLISAEDAELMTTLKQRVLRTGVGEQQEVPCTVKGIPSFWDLTLSSVYFFTDGLTTMAAYPANGQTPHSILPYSVNSLATHPYGDRFAVSHLSDTTPGQWVLAETSLSHPEKMNVLLRSETRITQLAYSADGARIAYVQQHSERDRELWLAPGGSESRESSLLVRGNIELGTRPFHPNGEGLVLTNTDAHGETSLQLIAVDTGDLLADLGPAAGSLWYPAQNYLLVSAQDLAGRIQLWAVSPEPPYQRQQLTHLGTGILPTVMLDGEYALTALPNTATIVIVALPDNPF